MSEVREDRRPASTGFTVKTLPFGFIVAMVRMACTFCAFAILHMA